MTFYEYMDVLAKVNNISASIDVSKKIKFFGKNKTCISLSVFDIAYKIGNRILMMEIIKDKNFNINDDLTLYYLDSSIEFNITNYISLLKNIICDKDYELFNLMLERDDLNVNIKDCKYKSVLSWLLNSSHYDKNIVNLLLGHINTNLDVPDVSGHILRKIHKLSNFKDCCHRSYMRNKISDNLLPYVRRHFYPSDILSLIVLISDNYYTIK